MIRNWKESPGKLALFLGIVASFVIAQWIHHTFFPRYDGRLETIFVFIAVMVATYVHFLIYRREKLRSLREELLSWGIVAAGFGAGMWISFAYLDGDSFLGDLPMYSGLLVALGADVLIRKWFRQA